MIYFSTEMVEKPYIEQPNEMRAKLRDIMVERIKRNESKIEFGIID